MNDWTFRSCWECNKAHEHLKTVKQLNCIVCGKLYEKGIEVGKTQPMLDGFLTDSLKEAFKKDR